MEQRNLTIGDRVKITSVCKNFDRVGVITKQVTWISGYQLARRTKKPAWRVTMEHDSSVIVVLKDNVVGVDPISDDPVAMIKKPPSDKSDCWYMVMRSDTNEWLNKEPVDWGTAKQLCTVEIGVNVSCECLIFKHIQTAKTSVLFTQP